MKENLTTKELEFKGIIEILTEQVAKVIDLTPVKQKIEESIRKEYAAGLNKVDAQFKPSVNVVMPPNSVRQLETLYNYTFQNIQAVGDELGQSIRQEMQRGLLNGDNKAQLVTRIKATFKDKKFQNRFKMIIRTETLRANNTAALEGAKQVEDSTGVKLKKWLDVTMDDRTTTTCIAEHKKYGTPSEAIPLTEEFVYTWDNKTYRAQESPFHPNCRTVLRFTRADQIEFAKVSETAIEAAEKERKERYGL